MFAAGPFQMALQFPEMIVRENANRRAAQLRAVDERSVRQFVEQDDIALAHEGGQSAHGRGVTAAKSERRRCFFPARECGFQSDMRSERATDQA